MQLKFCQLYLLGFVCILRADAVRALVEESKTWLCAKILGVEIVTASLSCINVQHTTHPFDVFRRRAGGTAADHDADF